MRSREARIWALKTNSLSKGRKSHTVRWTVRGKESSKTFAKRTPADRFRSDLMQALNRGELFDVESGLPESMAPAENVATWFELVQWYMAMKWPGAAATSRVSMTESLCSVTSFLVRDLPGKPPVEVLRRALRDFALPPNVRERDRPGEIASAIGWLERASLPLPQVADVKMTRGVLDMLALRLNGHSAASSTTQRKRAVFHNTLQYAVELEKLEFNPIDKLRVRSSRKKVVVVVDRRVVANPTQVRELLTSVTYVGQRGRHRRGELLHAFFACLYYAALRPSEALGLRESRCHLPASGWGSVTLDWTRPTAGKRWTDSGEVHDTRGLKHRAENETRTVPIPPNLVSVLRHHVERFGTGPDGRLFCGRRGSPISASSYSRVWKHARTLALRPEQVDSPLAGRPYDLRHAALSLWLNQGVPAPEVAERAGHSVDVLLKVYAKCLDGQSEAINRRIEAALVP